jgi:HEAT repeat protein
VAIKAAKALARIGEASVPALFGALGNQVSHNHAIYGISNFPPIKKLSDLLIPYLKDEHWYIRQAAAFGLGKIGDIGAIEPLLEARHDKEPIVRAEVIHALGFFKDARIFDVSGCKHRIKLR